MHYSLLPVDYTNQEARELFLKQKSFDGASRILSFLISPSIKRSFHSRDICKGKIFLFYIRTFRDSPYQEKQAKPPQNHSPHLGIKKILTIPRSDIISTAGPCKVHERKLPLRYFCYPIPIQTAAKKQARL
ncbi:hypothetical protein TWF225_001626 [Orbilia oligospora]|uniref:Uncharacterized protein n=1 Tax=Orbilia oligospora TaxID=2813651 RepID=A0A7C8JWP0_ORBOL|nr:hypothetical protein TWF751_005039 [Orbilia oligospora]KAF3164640.1 hypothetical protein TWF225_001626 [Orbilia oligospora]KAF3256748.1 hypothetical protein TWF128_005250 [Orbilia oligospora]KAF3272528.1 hypothetical protein TWF217_000021 [Orbilia oligospora]KAF3292029.1 hypothetical protein TWF132_006273 [Orbilia oligospora]